jgi:sulfate adenylyltransferase
MTDPHAAEALPARLTALPSWHPSTEVLEFVELELDGVLPPGYVGSRVPLGAPDEVAAALEGGGGLVLEDAEGTPVAAYLAEPATAVAQLHLTPVRPFSHGPLRHDRSRPGAVRDGFAAAGSSGVVAVPLADPVPAAFVEGVVATASDRGAGVLWVVVTGAHRGGELAPANLLRAVREVDREVRDRGRVATQVVVVAVPHQRDHDADRALLDQVVRGYGADAVLHPSPLPGAEPHPAFARELARQQHPAHARGVTVFFTGLSGSGKSTVAKALAERIGQDSTRTVSLLDGDEVRRLLSARLTFSRADRDLNIRRIGFVAAEVTKHGGVAVCAPIAPFDEVRREVRRGVDAVGDFVLVHVATPLEECERRDRKGLYAKARRGEIPDFTGISSPYEEPDDAELRLDTTGRTIDECVDEVWTLLNRRGYLG